MSVHQLAGERGALLVRVVGERVGVLRLKGRAVEVLGRVVVHGFAAVAAWGAVAVRTHEPFALLLVFPPVAALRGGLCPFGLLCLRVVPGGGDFQHVFGALVFAARHDCGFAGVDGDDLGSCCAVFVEEVCAWCGVDDPHGVLPGLVV